MSNKIRVFTFPRNLYEYFIVLWYSNLRQVNQIMIVVITENQLQEDTPTSFDNVSTGSVLSRKDGLSKDY